MIKVFQCVKPCFNVGLSKARLSSAFSLRTLNVPNLLTATRIALVPGIGWSILHDRPARALALLTAAGLTDLVPEHRIVHKC